VERITRKLQRGFVLLDVLVALLIASTALLSALGGIALAARACRNGERRILELIAERNEDAQNRAVTYSAEKP
jgi:Tfp pilus assembly protein PilV